MIVDWALDWDDELRLLEIACPGYWDYLRRLSECSSFDEYVELIESEGWTNVRFPPSRED